MTGPADDLQRRLAALVAIDRADCARLVSEDENGTIRALAERRAPIEEPAAARGR